MEAASFCPVEQKIQRTAGLELPIKKIGSEQAKQTAPDSKIRLPASRIKSGNSPQLFQTSKNNRNFYSGIVGFTDFEGNFDHANKRSGQTITLAENS
jgi:hypothetical protein